MGNSVDCFNCYDGGVANDEVIFSFIDSFVWASWPGSVPMVRMGSYETVIAAMDDFLAQSKLGGHLANSPPRVVSARSS